MNRKQETEKRIFNLVYEGDINATVDHQDKPDFWITSVIQGKYGVEVTELFSNESAARLLKIPNYTNELLDKKNYRHKDDKELLKVDNIQIVSPDGTTIDTEAIVQKEPSISEYLKILVQRLKEKNESFKDYKKDLQHINLIIFDSSKVFYTIEHSKFFNIFFQPAVIDELLKSDFREIYFITSVEKKELNFPLKAILLFSRIFLFQDVLIESKKDIPNEAIYYRWFSEFLIHQGFSRVLLVNKQDENQVVFGNTGFLVKNLNQVVLRDYGDYKLPHGIIVNESSTGFVDEEIQTLIYAISKSFVFETGMSKEIIRHTTQKNNKAGNSGLTS